ncbi:hypothetical protein D9757_009047 [Collybiopsis confluens]|uniref:Major facilitator superfamily (MFS) profile domain-containing protein n=1 Tax=Collybiopsis confluens TaxID=2823264 RepID=A0A8H5HEA8_9AGAR|nr:hypothetical protein D9757_009047 [Collybiopsis confluens]
MSEAQLPTASNRADSELSRKPHSSKPPPARTPLPVFQAFLTLIIQFSEPITATVIYPFIIKAVRSTGITEGDEKKTGYYAGVIESVFFLTECLSVFRWGRASDKYGRRPVLLFGPLGLAIAMFGFGLSRSFWALMVFRGFQGVFNGNIGVARTVMTELTDPTNRVDLFTLTPIVWSLGLTLGPAIGGLLAYPADTWPNAFRGWPLFVQHPWFLPCAVTGIFSFGIFVVSFLGLKETSKRDRKSQRRSPSQESDGTLNENENTPLIQDDVERETYHSIATPTSSETPPESRRNGSFISLLSDPILRRTLLSHAFLAFTDMSYQVLIPLVYSTSISVGGLGLSPYQLGVIMATMGFGGGALNILVFKPILKRIGPRKTYMISYSALILDFGLFWVLRELAGGWFGRVNWVVWVLIGVQMVVSTFGYAMWNAMGLCIIGSAPPGALGATNGLAQTVSSGMRCLGPVFASSLYSISLETKLVGERGHLVELVMIMITLVGVCASTMLDKKLDGFETAVDE